MAGGREADDDAALVVGLALAADEARALEALQERRDGARFEREERRFGAPARPMNFFGDELFARARFAFEKRGLHPNAETQR